MTFEMGEQITLQDLGLLSMKTSPEPSAPTKEKTSKPSSRKSSGSRTVKPPMCLCLTGGGKWVNAGCLYDYLGRWSVAWRVHDAQFWGVPQRRKRIALVADFGGLAAPEVLFEREGVSGDSEQGAEAREATAGSVGESTDIAGTLDASYYKGCGERQGVEREYVMQVFGIGSYESNAMKSGNPKSGIYKADTSKTLDNNGGNPACHQGGMAVVAIEGNGSRPSHLGDGYAESETMYTLNSTEKHAVAYRKTGHPRNAREGQGWEPTNKSDTLNAFDNSETRTPTIVYERHDQDARYKDLGDVCETVSAKYGTGGGNMPIVLNDQGGGYMNVSLDKIGTLISQASGNPPITIQ